MEKDLANIQNQQEGKTIRDLFIIFKKSFWLILAIIVLFAALGLGYSFIETPSFTASRKVIITCENNGVWKIDSDGKPKYDASANNPVDNINTMNAYADTIMDFCDEGVVVDRANRYYINYLNSSYEDLDEYIEFLETSSVDSDAEGEIFSENIKLSKLAKEEEVNFSFKVEYTDENSQEAYDKLKLLIYAFKKEVLVTKEGSEETKYFGNFKVYVEDMGAIGDVKPNTSKTKNILIFGAIGVVISFLVVYIKTVANNTVTTKEELERIVGAPVFAAIENKE